MELPTIKGWINNNDILQIDFEPRLPESCMLYFCERAAGIYVGRVKTNEIDTILHYIQKLMMLAEEKKALYWNPHKEKWIWDPLFEEREQRNIQLFQGTFE